MPLVNAHDALYLARLTLYNQLGQPQQSLDLILNHQFHPWEGGECAMAAQYVIAHILMGRKALAQGDGQTATEHFKTALQFPESLGGERMLPVVDAPLYYYLGLAREMAGNIEGARACFRQVVDFLSDAWSLMCFPSLPYYQAMALRKLGEATAAQGKLKELLELTSKLETEASFDTASPIFQPFKDNPNKQKRIRHAYLLGLVRLGMGQKELARQSFEEVVNLDVNHIEAQIELHCMKIEPFKVLEDIGA